MEDQETQPVSVSRRIEAPAAEIFELLTATQMHPGIDGSGMLREGAPASKVSGVGDAFVMKMHNERLGDYEMDNHVVEFELNRRIGWEPALRSAERSPETPIAFGTRFGHRWIFDLAPDGPDATIVTEIYDCSGAPEQLRAAMDNGNVWLEGMSTTLDKLEARCTKPGA
jgi:uncharacterized protein YndB with AHSA1/START domain